MTAVQPIDGRHADISTYALLGRPLEDALRILADEGITAQVTWTKAFAGQREPRGHRERTDARVVRVRDRGRELTAALFPCAMNSCPPDGNDSAHL